MTDRADLVFVGGPVHTVNATDDMVEAVAVANGRILAVGGNADIRALAGSGTRVIELRGRSLLPGFIDAHCHFASVGAAMDAVDCSDAPITHYAPLFGIEQALTRRTMDGDVCGPKVRVDLRTAIRMHTINGAHAAFDEQIKGSLEPGKLADLVVLAEDVTRVPAERIRQVGVAMTVVGGEIAYEA